MFKKSKLVLIIFFVLLLLFYNIAFAVKTDEKEIKLDSILITNGLNETGFPLKFKKEFNLKEDSAVQYYVSWNQDNKAHKVLVEWIGPQEKLINQLKLFHFEGNTIKSYISLEEKVKKQLVVPKQVGEYLIKLYIDGELTAVTSFKLVK